MGLAAAGREGSCRGADILKLMIIASIGPNSTTHKVNGRLGRTWHPKNHGRLAGKELASLNFVLGSVAVDSDIWDLVAYLHRSQSGDARNELLPSATRGKMPYGIHHSLTLLPTRSA